MADTIIYVDLTNGAHSSAPWSYNEFISLTTVQELTADLNDDSNVGTGYSLDVTVAFSGATGGTSTATSGAGGWPETTFDYAYYSNGSGTLQIAGLTENDTYSLEVAGHASNSARDTDFTVTPANEGQTRYDSAGTGVPNVPIIFTGTIGAAGTIDIVGAVVSVFWYFNGFKLTITPAAGGGGRIMGSLANKGGLAGSGGIAGTGGGLAN